MFHQAKQREHQTQIAQITKSNCREQETENVNETEIVLFQLSHPEEADNSLTMQK